MSNVLVATHTDELRSDAAHKAAAHVASEHEAWVIWWGQMTRHYWAIPKRGPIHPAVEAVSPDELETRLREIEAWYGLGSGTAS
ncbi:hypothetical protein [Actinomadura gamaensis]|uniref:Uncharacterized protein n=1 Tax=Actinomadura gamaensis TaxID=1763541 RepID=A0ABV9UC53_9ACTN